MKKILLALTMALTMAGCTVVTPAADEVAVLVDRPVMFGEGGVRNEDVRQGGTRTYTWFSVPPGTSVVR